MRSVRWSVVPLFVLLFVATAQAAITVTVDGDPVIFGGTPPQMIGGRILVPLRGVMEKIGAQVSWQPELRTAVATKGATTVVLRIGERQAAVNDRPVMMDVPGMILAGSTMVPLRFLSEALGAEVKWHGAQQLVEIRTGVTPAPSPAPAALSIDSFTHDAETWVGSSSQVHLKLLGTPGAQASVRVPGLVERQALTASEPGVYQGVLVIGRDAAPTTKRVPVIGELALGGKSQLIQAGRELMVDTTAPVFGVASPSNGSRVGTARPALSLTYDDGAGSGVATGGVTVTVNGRDVTPAARAGDSQVVYQPSEDLPAGANTVRVALADRAGNVAERTWSFDVVTLQTVVKSFTHDAAKPLEPGDQVTVTMQAEAGGQARFRIGDGELRTMPEVQAGVYRAAYTIRKGDVFNAAAVHGQFTTRGGHSYDFDAPTTVSTAVTKVALAVPRITIPGNGDTVGKDLTVKGLADPGVDVKVKIVYRSKLLGLLTVTGVAAEETVKADDKGVWITRAIDLDKATGAKASSYTITAWAVAADGRQSEPASIEVKR